MGQLPGGKFPYLPVGNGGMAAYRAAQAISQKLAAGAVVAYPTDDLQQVLSAQGGTLSGGPTILLSPGTWDFTKTLEITHADTQIVALSPGRSVFRRQAAAVSTGPLVKVTAPKVSISGVAFQDDWGAAEQELLIDLRESEFTLERCRVDNCWRAVEATGESVIRVVNNDFYGYSDVLTTLGGVLKFTSCTMVIVSGNQFVQAYPIGVLGQAAVYFDDTSTYCTVTSNVNPNGTVLSRKTPAVARVEEAANTYVVESR